MQDNVNSTGPFDAVPTAEPFFKIEAKVDSGTGHVTFSVTSNLELIQLAKSLSNVQACLLDKCEKQYNKPSGTKTIEIKDIIWG